MAAADPLADSCRLLGIDPARLGGAGRPLELVIAWEANRPAITLFFACASAWRMLAVPGGFTTPGRVMPLGLDWPAVAAIAGMIGTAITPALFDQLRQMEAAALGEWQRASQ